MNATFIRSNLRALAPLILSATLVLAACGGGDASPPAESVPPTVNIASSVVSGAAAGPVTFTFTFSEDVGASFTADAVSVSNGSKGAFNKVSATQYTLVVTPAANAAGNIGVSIAANVVADLVGNKMPVAATQSQGFDTRPPTVAVTNDAATGTAKGVVTFTFNFSKDVGASFTADDVVVTGGGTKGAFTRVSSTQYTLAVTPTANSNGTLNVTIAAGAFSDAGGAGNPTASNLQLAFDTRPAGPNNAPTTTIAAGSVVIYSEAATVAGFNPRPDWGQTVAYSEANLAGNKSLKYTFQGGGFGAAGAYEGMDWAGSPQNVSTQSKLRMDLWSNDLTSLTISIISAGKESAVTRPITKGSWNAVDIDLAAFTAPDKTAIIQIKIESATAGDIYIDNIHFAGGGATTGCGSTAPTCAPTTTIPSGSVVIYSEAATVAGFNPRPDWGQSVAFSEANIAGNKSLKYTFQGGGFGAVGAYEGLDWAANPVNVAAKTKLHMDLWSNDLTSLKISIIGGGKESAVTQPVTKGSWNSVDIDLASFTAPDKTAIIQIKIESATAGDIYIDNIHFWGGAAVGCGTTAPTCAPTTPIPAGSVVIYSEAATVANFNPRPDWGQSVTFSEANIASNKSLKYTFQGGGFGAVGAYEGLDWAANPVNVASKGKLHMDLWSADITSMKISIIGGGKETAVTQPITAGSWNSVDIDLAQFTAPDKSAIIQIKIESATAGAVYIDNIHFWGTASTGGSGPNPSAEPGSAGPVTIPVATASDKFGFILSGDAIFAADYIGPKDNSGNSAMFPGATSTGAAASGNIGFYNDNTLSTSSQKLEEGGWVSGSIDQQGVPNFFRYFVLNGPASTFSSSFMGLFVNAPNNGTVNVSSYGSIKLKLWGPAEMYEKPNLNPVVELIFAGPKVAGCTATGSGGTEISKTFNANQKIGAGSSYKISLAAWTVKGVCGSDTNATAVASVLAKLARVVLNVPASSFNFVNANPGATPSYSSGINLGPIGFTNQ
jgi:Bacterial Ig-like domain